MQILWHRLWERTIAPRYCLFRNEYDFDRIRESTGMTGVVEIGGPAQNKPVQKRDFNMNIVPQTQREREMNLYTIDWFTTANIGRGNPTTKIAFNYITTQAKLGHLCGRSLQPSQNNWRFSDCFSKDKHSVRCLIRLIEEEGAVEPQLSLL